MSDALATTPIIDMDAHVTEPADLWTSRMPKKWVDAAPQLRWSEKSGEDIWMMGDIPVSAAGQYSVAGWPEYIPSRPHKLDEVDPACSDPKARLAKMDEHGVQAQVIYPNLIGFCPRDFWPKPSSSTSQSLPTRALRRATTSTPSSPRTTPSV